MALQHSNSRWAIQDIWWIMIICTVDKNGNDGRLMLPHSVHDLYVLSRYPGGRGGNEPFKICKCCPVSLIMERSLWMYGRLFSIVRNIIDFHTVFFFVSEWQGGQLNCETANWTGKKIGMHQASHIFLPGLLPSSNAQMLKCFPAVETETGSDHCQQSSGGSTAWRLS